jgi:hypothetical protein
MGRVLRLAETATLDTAAEPTVLKLKIPVPAVAKSSAGGTTTDKEFGTEAARTWVMAIVAPLVCVCGQIDAGGSPDSKSRHW